MAPRATTAPQARPDRRDRPAGPPARPAPPGPGVHRRGLVRAGRLARWPRSLWSSVGYLHILDFSGLLGFAVCWYLVFVLVYDRGLAVIEPPADRGRAARGGDLVPGGGHRPLRPRHHRRLHVRQGLARPRPRQLLHPRHGGRRPDRAAHPGRDLATPSWARSSRSAIAVAMSVPLGIGTAVYMTEVGGRGSQLVRTVVEAMTALPEILAGLFVYVVLIVGFGLPEVGLAASVAMAVTMTPIIARAGEVALRVVPSGLREASERAGAPPTGGRVRKVVLPSARAGLATARHPRHRPGHRRDRHRPHPLGRVELPDLQPVGRADELAAAVHLHRATPPTSRLAIDPGVRRRQRAAHHGAGRSSSSSGSSSANRGAAMSAAEHRGRRERASPAWVGLALVLDARSCCSSPAQRRRGAAARP